jgi:phosphocarrier protein
MLEQKIEIINKLGLHARASAKLVKEASKYDATIQLVDSKNNKINAKSIMGIMMLGAKCGDMLKLIVDGEEEQQALDGIVALFNDKFGEHEVED